MTKGQLEAKISEAVSKYEVDYMGRGPKKIKTIIIGDSILIRLIGFLSQSEQILVQNNDGVELYKKMRTILFEKNLPYFKQVINELIPTQILSIHSDVSTITGEKIILISFDVDLEEKLMTWFD